VELGEAAGLFEAPRHPYTQSFVQDVCADQEPPLRSIGGRLVACHLVTD
jgi:ABC-type dipeptide/oligopeptide/nickel transport system ATPase component